MSALIDERRWLTPIVNTNRSARLAPGLGRHSHGDRVSAPNLRDAGRDRNAAGGREDDGTGAKTSRARNSPTQMAETHLFDLARTPQVGRPQNAIERAQTPAGDVYVRAGCRVCS